MPELKVLVAGNAGQVASALVSAAPGEFELTLEHPQLDLTDRRNDNTAVGSIRPDSVIDARAYTAVEPAEVDNAGAFPPNAEGARAPGSVSADLGN